MLRFIIFLAIVNTALSTFVAEWAPLRGRSATQYTFSCPDDGAIIGLRYRYGDLIDSIQFICNSSFGQTESLFFGGLTGNVPKTLLCPTGSYVGSIAGEAAEYVHKLVLRCIKDNSNPISVAELVGAGTMRKPTFDDINYAIKQYGNAFIVRRPIEIKVHVGIQGWINGIQARYTNQTFTAGCKVTHIEVTDNTLVAQDDGFEIVGMASGSSCSSIDQVLTLQSAQSVSETLTVETTNTNEYSWERSVSVTTTTGLSWFVVAEVSVGVTTTNGGSTSLSNSNAESITHENQKTYGTEITYKAPGAAILIGYMKRYKITQDHVPVVYHFRCSTGNTTTRSGTIRLSSKTYGKVDFEDYQHALTDESFCTEESRLCVKSLDGSRLVSYPHGLKEELERCFPSNSTIAEHL